MDPIEIHQGDPLFRVTDLHVALIMDGNGRWAKSRGRGRIWGHVRGVRVLKDIVRACPEAGVTALTVYAFSSENWNRDPQEVSALMRLFARSLRRLQNELVTQGVCVRFLGQRHDLPAELVQRMDMIETLTRHHTRLRLQIALNYGGRMDVTQAVRTLARQVAEGGLQWDAIDESHVGQTLWTRGCPDPDLCIRTGGEMRLSNYMLWQMHYTELLFLEKNWPDFTPQDLMTSIQVYRGRQRRFGGHVQLSYPHEGPLSLANMGA